MKEITLKYTEEDLRAAVEAALLEQHKAFVLATVKIFEGLKSKMEAPMDQLAKDEKGWPKIGEQLQHWFSYHSPNPDDLKAYEKIRNAGLVLAQTIVENTPPSADQSAAIRKVREAVMTANAARACAGQ